METSPDADTPRPCGVALLDCAMERSDEPVAGALLGMAGQLQSATLEAEGVLLREATYRAVGECFPRLRTKVDFGSWYASELRLMLGASETGGLHEKILRARALWLIGCCGEELGPLHWGEAFGLLVNHLTSQDLVVSDAPTP